MGCNIYIYIYIMHRKNKSFWKNPNIILSPAKYIPISCLHGSLLRPILGLFRQWALVAVVIMTGAKVVDVFSPRRLMSCVFVSCARSQYKCRDLKPIFIVAEQWYYNFNVTPLGPKKTFSHWLTLQRDSSTGYISLCSWVTTSAKWLISLRTWSIRSNNIWKKTIQ